MLKTKPTGRKVMVIALGALVAFAVILVASIRLAYCLQDAGENDTPAWVQAVGAIMAIVVGFATILCQRALESADAEAARDANARAAHLVATHAMTTVGERLDAVLAPENLKRPYRLRGERTLEMIASLRNFDTARIPHEMLESFLQLRANLHSINERISEIYDSERETLSKPRSRGERPLRLEGAVVIWSKSRTLLNTLREQLIAAGQTGLAADLPAFAFEVAISPVASSKRSSES